MTATSGDEGEGGTEGGGDEPTGRAGEGGKGGVTGIVGSRADEVTRPYEKFSTLKTGFRNCGSYKSEDGTIYIGQFTCANSVGIKGRHKKGAYLWKSSIRGLIPPPLLFLGVMEPVLHI